MKKMRSPPALLNTFCTALTNWLDQQPIDISRFPRSHSPALTSQNQIGWQQIFQGKITQEWELLFDKSSNPTGSFRQRHRWAANVVTTILKYSLEIWEERNTQFHGQTQAQQHDHLLEHQRHIIRDLLSKKQYCLARDQFIFPSDPSNILNNTSTIDLANWIASRKPLIQASMKQAKAKDLKNTPTLYHWFTTKVAKVKPKLRQWARDNLIYDPYSKKKRHKTRSNSQVNIQQPIQRYLSLTSTFNNH